MVHLSHVDVLDDLKKALEGRIQALANVHSLFVATRWIEAELSTIARQELVLFEDRRDAFANRRPGVFLEPDIAQSLAITLHELATNATKYGSLSVSNGQIELNWSHQDDGLLNLRWTEMGGPLVRVPTR